MSRLQTLNAQLPLLLGIGLSALIWLATSTPTMAASPTPDVPPTHTPVVPTPTRATPTPVPTNTVIWLTSTPTSTPIPTATAIPTAYFWGAVEATAQTTGADPIATARANPRPTRTPAPTLAAGASPVSVFGSDAAWIPPAQENEERIRLTVVEARLHPPTSTAGPQIAAASVAEPTRTTEQILNSAIPQRMRLSGPVDAPEGAPDSAARAPQVNRGSYPPPPPIRYAGVPSQSTDAGWVNATTLWLSVPHRTQFDSTVWAQTNCGPVSLAMILEAYGLTGYGNDALRGEVNRLQGDSNPDNGTSLYAISSVAQRAGLYPMGLGKRWTLDDVRSSLAQGRPIITLTRYADLPGNGRSDPGTNHYIVLSGLSGDNIIYNDPAYSQGAGRALLIPPDTLMRAWANSDVPGQAVAFALDATGAGLMSPVAMRQHLFSAAGPSDPGTYGEVIQEGSDAYGIALSQQRELYWKAAILGISNQPLLSSYASGPGGSDLEESSASGTTAASMIDSGLAVPLQMLALIILALLAISGPLSLAFLRIPPKSDRE